MALPTSRIAKLFSIANESRLHKGASESERHKARWELLLEFHSQREQLKREEITRIDRYLEQGIKDWGYRIFAEPDPIRALEIFLGDRHKRGKRAKYAERDRQITVAVVEKMNASISLKKAPSEARVVAAKRMSLAKAYEEVASEYGLEPESVEKIYKRHRKEVRADAGMRFLERARAGTRALLTK